MNLTAVVNESNCTTVSITVSWVPLVNNATGYVIYYQQRGGEVMSERVMKGEAEIYTLDGLQRGVTYNISIVALSDHLPSPLVGPVTVYQGKGLKVSCLYAHYTSIVRCTTGYRDPS